MRAHYIYTLFYILTAYNGKHNILFAVYEIDLISCFQRFLINKPRKAVTFRHFDRFRHTFALGFSRVEKFHIFIAQIKHFTLILRRKRGIHILCFVS